MMINVAAMYGNPAEAPEHDAWASGLTNALGRNRSGLHRLPRRRRGGGRPPRLPARDLERLAEVKRQYDPDNLFRLNLNVPPAKQ